MNASEKKGDESKVRRKQTLREEAKADENLVLKEDNYQLKELPLRETKDNKKTFKSFKTVGLSTPSHRTANESVERLRFPKENNVSSAIAVP